MDKRRAISRGRRLRFGHAAVAALLVVALGALAWAGGDPWKTQPYDQWTQKEVSEILRNSPWAKAENVPADWKPSRLGPANTQEESAPRTGAAPSMGGVPAGPAGANGGAAPGSADEDREQNGASQGQVTYYVRWNSSRTMREALVRDAILSGKIIKESAAEKYLSAPITDYEVLVVGSDMTPFVHSMPDQLKAKSFLLGEESKVEVNAITINMVLRSPEGGQVTGVLFTFLRKAPDGRDVAAPKEKGLRFECKLKDLDLRTTFDPRKMADQKGPDF